MLPGVPRSLTLGLNIVNKNYHLIFSSDLLLTIICQTFNNTRGARVAAQWPESG